jgi:hypothetical protein
VTTMSLGALLGEGPGSCPVCDAPHVSCNPLRNRDRSSMTILPPEPMVTVAHPPIYNNRRGEVSTEPRAGFYLAYAADTPLPLRVARSLGIVAPPEGA